MPNTEWLVFPCVLVAIIALYAAIGLPFAVVFARRSQVSIALAPVFGLAVLAIAGTWYSLLERPMHQWPIIVVAIVSAVVGTMMLARQKGTERGAMDRTAWLAQLPDRKQLNGALFATLPWICGAVGFIVFVVPMISDPRMPPGFVTSFTSSNNDLASYILQAANIQLAGFGDSGLSPFGIPYVGISEPLTLGELSIIDHPGAMTLLAGTATALGVSTWQVGTLVVLAAGVALTSATYALAVMTLGVTRVQALVVSMLASMTALIYYVTSAMFFAQLLAMGLVVAQIAVVNWAIDRREWRALFVGMPVLAGATFFISPEVQVIAWVTLGMVTLFAVFCRKTQPGQVGGLKPTLKQVAIAIGALAGAFAGSLLIFSPFLGSAIRLLLLLNSEGVAGWELSLAGTPSLLFGIDVANVHAVANTSLSRVGIADVVGVLLLGAVVLVAGVLGIRRRDKVVLRAFLLVGWLTLLLVLAAQHWGWESYQTWKLAMSYSPILAALIVGTLLRGLADQVRARHAAIAIALVAVGANVTGNQQMWRPIAVEPELFYDRAITAEYAKLLKGDLLQAQPGANFRGESLFITMASPAIYGKASAMSERNYFSPEANGNGFPFPCTVGPKAWPFKEFLPDAQVVARTRNYIVVGTQACGAPLARR